MEVAWQAHFVKNMFIRPEPSELENFKPNLLSLMLRKQIILTGKSKV